MFTTQVFSRESVTEPFDCVWANRYNRRIDALKAAFLAADAIAFRNFYLWSVKVLDGEGREVYRKGFNVWDN